MGVGASIDGRGDSGSGIVLGDTGRGTSPSWAGDVLGAASAAPGDGESGWSKTGTGVLDGVERTDGLGDVRSEASPMANLALSLSSRVVLDREVGRAAGDDESGCGLRWTGLPARCVASDLRRFVTASAAICPDDESEWRRDGSVVGLDGSAAEVVAGGEPPSWDNRGACCARFSMVCFH